MNQPTFADLTTIGVGGSIARFIEPTSRVAVIEAVEEADALHIPLCVIGGGSNMLVSDEPFEGVVVRDARTKISVPDEAAPVEDGVNVQQGAHIVHVNAEAGCNWDDFVAHTIDLGLEGVEALSGIPGTVGASVVQNIGAYGQEVAQSVESVEVWDRQDKKTIYMQAASLRFAYRTSLLKQSMYEAPGVASTRFFPTPRYVVLSVTFRLRHNRIGMLAHAQLANALHTHVGDMLPVDMIRREVLRVRASKGMLEDALRYQNPWMITKKSEQGIMNACDLQFEDSAPEQMHGIYEHDLRFADRHSCGSFFMNPILSLQQAADLPSDAPRYDVLTLAGDPAVKTSAAWLIDHAGFHKGFRLRSDDGTLSPAALSSLHTLALTNRGGASARDVLSLASVITQGVEERFGICLVPEPVCIGLQVSVNN